jgi:hypothetical protein
MTEDENERSLRDFFEHMAAERKLARSQPDWTEDWNCAPTDAAIERETERLVDAYLVDAYKEVLYRRLGHDSKQHGSAIPGQRYAYEAIEGSWEASKQAHEQAERLRPLFYDMARSLVEQD